MIIPIANLISSDDLQTITHLIEDATFTDGKETAGWHARDIKNNEQLLEGAQYEKISKILSLALQKNELFNIAAMPHVMRPFLISCSQNNGNYGPHVDNAIMTGRRTSRTDISMTIFLSDPDSYEGGELVIEETAGERRFKLPAGFAVFYPSTTLHRVEPVTKGARYVACTWVQSRIRDAQQREIIFDLDTTRRKIYEQDGKSREFDLLSKTHANLIRMWAEI